MKTTQTHMLIGLMAAGSMAMGGSVTIPHTFTANTTAVASEVNANFAAVKTAVDGNANDIATNANDIATNSVGSMWVRDHEGNIHPTVTIGNQTWMADNMYVTTYQDGTSIDDESTWTDSSNDAYAYPIRQASNYIGGTSTPVAVKGDIDVKRYGLFYQYNAAVKNDTSGHAQGICPNGWHIPTKDDWDTLQAALGDNTVAYNTWSNGALEKIGDQLKVGGKSGFSALYSGGHAQAASGYFARGSNAYFWVQNTTAEYGSLTQYQAGIYRNSVSPDYGFSVRCIKD